MDQRLRSEEFWPRLRAALDAVPVEQRTAPARARVGAVLVLLEEGPDGPVVVLTRRRQDLRAHPGQVSFAGGRLDPGETTVQAALREAREEIGLAPDSVEVFGAGPVFYIPPSRFWVVPVVARWQQPHPLEVNPWEVDEVLRVPVAHLLDWERWRHAPMSMRGSTWAWQLDDDLLWGATAMVLGQVLDTVVPDWSDGLRPEDLDDELAVRPWEQGPSWPRRVLLEGELPTVVQDDVPHVTRQQVRDVRAWLDARGVDGRVRAEQAGRAVAQAVRRLVGTTVAGVGVTLLCGPSSNGAGGLVGARLLAAAGARVQALTVGAPRYPEQTHVLRESGVEIAPVREDELDGGRAPAEVVVDALLGVGAEPPMQGLAATAGLWLRRHDVPVVSLELPSGLSADHGLRGACIAADVTVALGLPLVGLQPREVHAFLGDVYLADLGVPLAGWRAVGIEQPATPLFGTGPLLRLADAPDADQGGGDGR